MQLLKFQLSRLAVLLCLLTPWQALAQKPITLDDCFTFFKFYPENGPDFRFLPDGRHYTLAEDGGIVRYDLFTQKRDSVLARKSEINLEFDDYTLSPDQRYALLRSHTEPVYRHSVVADYHVFDFQSRRLTPVNTNGLAQTAVLSPDGANVAFVQGNNLFVKNVATQQVTQITTDGKPNAVINGLADWVYEEEFSPVQGDGMAALAWNPDGQRLAFLRFDERQVPEMALNWYEGKMYPRRSHFKYPKVGDPNSVVEVKIYDLPTQRLADVEDSKVAGDDYLVRLKWASKFNLVVTRLNRRQNQLDLVLLAPDRLGKELSFKAENLLTETDSAYVELEFSDFFRFLNNGQQFVWGSERSGFNHIYLYDFVSGNLVRPLTTGNFDVTTFYGVDEKTGKFYFQAATPTPMDRQVWEGDLKGGAPRLLTPKTGTSTADFCPTFEYYALTWSDANTPTVATLCDRTGNTLKTFTDNPRVRRTCGEYGWVNKEFFQIPTPDGTLLNAWKLTPAKLDSARRYPVLFDIYGGPGAQTVLNEFDGYKGAWHQLLVQKGYVIVSVDNRGTGGRGRVFKKSTQLQLGRHETEDQIAAARWLGTQSWVDSTRIGIWGWSFGGYLSTSCILKGNTTFKMAMAVAPVANWKWYDSAYTERYMHTNSDNAAGYDDNAPINFVSRLRGSNYLLCHGIADDNVHWQQTAELTNALIRAGKQFDTYYYPNRDHGIYGDNATRHLFTKLTDFVQEKL